MAVIQEAWISGVLTRRVDELVQAMGLSGVSKSTASKLCKDIDQRVGATWQRCRVHWMRHALRHVGKTQQSIHSNPWPPQHRTKLHSTNSLERLDKEVKRRAGVVGIFPSEASITRLIGAVLLEANDEWQIQHRYMGAEA